MSPPKNWAEFGHSSPWQQKHRGGMWGAAQLRTWKLGFPHSSTSLQSWLSATGSCDLSRSSISQLHRTCSSYYQHFLHMKLNIPALCKAQFSVPSTHMECHNCCGRLWCIWDVTGTWDAGLGQRSSTLCESSSCCSTGFCPGTGQGHEILNFLSFNRR